MFSIKKGTFSKFATFMLQKHVFCFVSLFSFSCLGAQPVLKVREFRYYREFQLADSKIFVDKKNLNINYSGIFGNIKVEKKLLGKTYTFHKSERQKDHFFILASDENKKIEKIGYLSRGMQTQFSSEICEPKEVFANNTKRILSPDLIGKIKELKVTNLFDKESCGGLTEERFEEFKKVLIGTLVYKQSSLQKCLDSKVARDVFQGDLALLNNANEVFKKYLDLIDNLENSKMKLKCGMAKDSENKIASFSQNPLEIAINVINEKFNLKIDNIKSAMNHELFHMGMQQYKTSEGSRCMDEGFVKLFENVCKYSQDTTLSKPPLSSQIVDSCLKGIDPDIQKLSLSKFGTQEKGRGGVVAALVAESPLENREQSKQVTQALVPAANASAQPVFEAVPDSVIQLAATAPVMTTSGRPLSAYEGDGEFYTVVADSSFTSSVRQLGQSLSASMNNADKLLTTALGNKGLAAAAVATGAVAVAATGNGGGASSSAATAKTVSGQYVPMTASEIFMDRYYPDSKEVQAVMNNPALDKMTYDQKETFYRNGGTLDKASVTLPLASDSRATIQSGSLKSVADSAGGGTGSLKGAKAGTDAAGGSANSAKGRNIASLPSQAVPFPQEDGAVEPSSPKKVSVANAGSTAVLAQPSSALDKNSKLNKVIVERLNSFNKVNEPAYSKVTQRFNDEAFRQQADLSKIRIIGEDGKPLWTTSVQPRRCFRDNKTTKVLEVVTCK